MSIIETWQPIPTLELRYEASDQGRIRNIQSNKILKCDSKNSPCVSIVVNQTTTVFEVKLLVDAAFLRSRTSTKISKITDCSISSYM